MLKVVRLSKRFGGLTAVEDVSFEVRPGDLLGIIGPNGAGKTTCFHMIAGSLVPTAGQILFEGREIQGLPPYRISRLGIARSFQIVKPFTKLTVEENVLVAALSRHPMKRARTIAEEIMALTQLEALRRQRAGELSIGNLKRLEVARALATRPKLLLLDEPMGGLNPKEVDQAIALLRRINQSGVTIVMIEHVMRALMAVAKNVLVLHHGALIASGTPAEVASDPEVIQAYLGEAYDVSG